MKNEKAVSRRSMCANSQVEKKSFIDDISDLTIYFTSD
jgi:hypothetical protein